MRKNVNVMRDLKQIRQLVGDISEDQLRYVDCAVNENVGVFMPIAGQCYYAISPRHTHPAYSFILAFDDKCRTRIGEDIIDSVPSTMAVLPPDVPHQELPADSVSRYIAIMISSTFFHAQLSAYGVSDVPDSNNLYPINERLVHACKEFVIDYQEAFPGYEKLLESGALKICHLIIRQMYRLEGGGHPVSTSIAINRAVEYIYSNYSERISVETLAAKANLSPSHFSKLFKQEMRFAPAEYLMNVRLAHAKRMLRAKDKTLTEIALDCGFNTSSYFSKCFSAAFSMSPSAFRKLHSA